MRDLKFRAWYTLGMKEQYMINDFHTKDCFQSILCKEDTDEDHHSYFTIMQYTGLKDKNGTEIYEGDMLKDGKGDNGVVEYTEDIACFMVRVGGNLFHLNEKDTTRGSRLQYTTIIGNIHENPELLEKVK